MSKKTILVSWLVLIVAILAWTLVGYGAYGILQTASARAASAKIALTKANQVSLNQRVHTLAVSTEASRAELEAITGSDIVAIIEVIDAAAKSAGVSAKVSDAASDGPRQVVIGKSSLKSVTFSVQGTGQYANLMHLVRMYETLPLLSTLEQVEIERVQLSSAQASWRISARIRVLTTANVSI